MTLPALRFKNCAPISTERKDSTCEPVSFNLLDQSLVDVGATDARNPESPPSNFERSARCDSNALLRRLAKALSVTFPEARVSGTSLPRRFLTHLDQLSTVL
jgi:hypothetical protein